MKKHALIAAGIFALSMQANAGVVQPAPVQIDEVAMSAMGDMVTARFSANESELIGCGVRSTVFDDGSEFNWGFCQARLSEDLSAFCTTQNETLINRMADISDYSYITFRWNEAGDCTYVGASTQSFYIPEHLDKKPK